MVITTVHGLLYIDGILLDVVSADQIAREHGYLYAERMVHALEKDPTAVYNPEVFPNRAKHVSDRKIINPLTGNKEPIISVLRSLAGQDGCDGEPYDQMQLAADYIEYLESILGKPDFMIFKGELVIKHIK